MLQSALTSEMATWSTKLLTQLVEEEDCSMVARNAAINALSLRSAPASGNTVTLTSGNIHALLNYGAPNQRQVALLHLPWPPPRGWISRLEGTVVSQKLYAELLGCKGTRPRGMPRKEWKITESVNPS